MPPPMNVSRMGIAQRMTLKRTVLVLAGFLLRAHIPCIHAWSMAAPCSLRALASITAEATRCNRLVRKHCMPHVHTGCLNAIDDSWGACCVRSTQTARDPARQSTVAAHANDRECNRQRGSGQAARRQRICAVGVCTLPQQQQQTRRVMKNIKNATNMSSPKMATATPRTPVSLMYSLSLGSQ
jgi:hypothetical protein